MSLARRRGGEEDLGNGLVRKTKGRESSGQAALNINTVIGLTDNLNRYVIAPAGLYGGVNILKINVFF